MRRNWSELIKPRKVEFSGGEDSRYKTSLVLEPLERGFGTTLGNALRRVLISSLEGAAISSVKIAGVMHAMATIPNVEEDVAEIILNLKGVIVYKESDAPGTLTLKVEKAGAVTAGDIVCEGDMQILNPTHPIATIRKGGKLDMVMTVTIGKGYVRANAIEPGESVASGGEIFLDCSYNPVKNVSYKVFNARIGQQTDYDKLVFDIETNGVITPRGALALAGRILKEQLNAFINFDEQSIQEELDDVVVKQWDLNLFRKVEDMDLSVRAANCLKGEGVIYIADLVQKNESKLLKMPNFGRKSLNEIKNILKEMGLSLDMHLEGWPPDDMHEIARQFDC